ncbi:hypothetical protein E4U21_006856 [Claviceps maximensis]|nr:hypothetical protein E4U21_006856 [Claviceps maximensis]
MEHPFQPPDFMQVANNVRIVADNFERCKNLPAIDGGVQIMAMLNTMMNKMDERFVGLEQRFEKVEQRLGRIEQRLDGVERRLDGVERRVGAVEQRLTTVEQRLTTVEQRLTTLEQDVQQVRTELKISNRNAMVRAQNMGVTSVDKRLVPLYSVLTGEEIEGFPETMNQLEKLPAREVDRILRHIGESVEGTASAKKQILKFATGPLSRPF